LKLGRSSIDIISFIVHDCWMIGSEVVELSVIVMVNPSTS